MKRIDVKTLDFIGLSGNIPCSFWRNLCLNATLWSAVLLSIEQDLAGRGKPRLLNSTSL